MECHVVDAVVDVVVDAVVTVAVASVTVVAKRKKMEKWRAPYNGVPQTKETKQSRYDEVKIHLKAKIGVQVGTTSRHSAARRGNLISGGVIHHCFTIIGAHGATPR